MKDNCILTAESVTEGHPDKLCDTIADAVVDARLTQDAAARVACEVMATAGKIIAAGEITAAKIPDIPAIICRTVREAGYGGSDYEVEVITHEQSPDIAEAVSASLIFSAFAAFSSIAQTIFGCRARACSSNKFMRRLVVNATTSASIEGRISTVCVPIEPVEPKIAIFFIIFLLLNDLG